MAIYDEVRRDFEKFHRAKVEQNARARTFIEQFAEGFREYIGAPYAYEAKDAGGAGGAPQRYVEPLPVDSAFRPEQPKHAQDRARQQPDGEWRSAIRVILEPGPNTGPKLPWICTVRFRLKGRTVTLSFGQETREFTVSVDDPNGFRPAYDCVADLLRSAVRGEDWDEQLPADASRSS